MRAALGLAVFVALLCGILPLQAQSTPPDLGREMWEAAMEGQFNTVKSLLDRGAPANADPLHRGAALVYAASRNDVPMIQLLLQHGAEPNLKADKGFTALSVAALHGHLESMKVLMQLKGIDLNSRNVWGGTALYTAVTRNQFAAAQMLLAAGADPTLKTKDGETALSYAKSYLDGDASLDAQRKERLQFIKLLEARTGQKSKK